MNDEDVKNDIMNINTATGRVKANNFAVGTQLALSLQDPHNNYNYIGFHAIIKTLIQGFWNSSGKLGQSWTFHISKRQDNIFNIDLVRLYMLFIPNYKCPT